MTIKTKILYDNIEIDDPIALIAGDVNSELKAILTRKYANRCYMSVLVLQIIRIIRRGDCLVNQEAVNKQWANPVCGRIYVEFEVECLVYNSGEIITGCKVMTVDDYMNIYCETAYADIYLRESKHNSTIQRGQIISIVVENTQYDVMQERFSVSGVIFVPSVHSVAYEIGAQPPSDALLSLLDDLELDEKDTTTVAWKTFTTIISPYKSNPTVPKGKVADALIYARGDVVQSLQDKRPQEGNVVQSLQDKRPQESNNEKKEKFVLRDSRAGLTTSTIYLVDNETDLPENTTIIRGLTFDTMMIAIIGNYQNYQNCVQGMCENYSNEEIIKAHSNLWRLFNSCKV
jgi:hypothetical protein